MACGGERLVAARARQPCFGTSVAGWQARRLYCVAATAIAANKARSVSMPFWTNFCHSLSRRTPWVCCWRIGRREKRLLPDTQPHASEDEQATGEVKQRGRFAEDRPREQGA